MKKWLVMCLWLMVSGVCQAATIAELSHYGILEPYCGAYYQFFCLQPAKIDLETTVVFYTNAKHDYFGRVGSQTEYYVGERYIVADRQVLENSTGWATESVANLLTVALPWEEKIIEKQGDKTLVTVYLPVKEFFTGDRVTVNFNQLEVAGRQDIGLVTFTFIEEKMPVNDKWLLVLTDFLASK